MRPIRFLPALIGVFGAAFIGGPFLYAQDVDPLATQARLSIGQQIAIDNGDVMGVTPIDLQFKTGTRSQVLEFSTSLPITENDPDQDSTFRLSEPSARLFYRRFVRDSSIETTFAYSQSDLERERYYDDITGDLITLQGGTVTNSSARLGYVFGSQSKFGGEFGFGYSKRNYTDTVDAGLRDSESKDGSLRLYFEPIATIRARLLASINQVDSDGGTDSKITRIGAGVSIQLDKLTNLDAEIRHDTIRREYQDARGVDETSGPALSLNLTRSRPTGDWVLALASTPGTGGRSDRVTLSRGLEMPGYQLSAMGGVVHFDGEADGIYRITLNREFGDRSNFSTALNRNVSFNNDGEKRIRTDLSANYSRALTSLSRISGGVRYQESQSTDGDDDNSLSFNINYNHSLSDDISLVAGYRRNINSDDDDDDNERIYLGLTRSFTWLP